MPLLRLTGLALAMAAGLAIVSADLAEARIGGGRSLGSRGNRTFTAPPATNTTPGAAPIDRSISPRTAPTTAQSPAQGINAATRPSMFGGMRGLLLGGLFVAALGGIFGFGALASALGFILQFALIAGLIYLAFAFFRRRSGQPAMASANAGGNSGRRPDPVVFQREGPGAVGGSSELKIGPADFDSFERLLGEIQTAYSREDADQLGAKTTPEMLSYFMQELSDLQEQGVRNEISGVKLLQGDLSESWRENGSDYATVAIRYALTDVTTDRKTGRVVAGDPTTPGEVTELWTFRRDDRSRADGWQLSAIQQAA